ncbi:putative uncharacterized protein DDB_G0293878 isoform X5 [Sitodiplosis mosellana]|uniref:putative uncharacterized protein DDB_G0293878 isoform X5 n=1 Tax=Sitodiplosis mosellana TaxID=263140 RepID=UPI0024445204|nr:putative uncharacterized protein DDB_G0293878 isoform X5 [Sitodiplosis mosellana]XP_055310310.1 putative uncharacterized protein DDB_G0293878 isoform X5 [Sitodiplosis mosellana]XP_055310311.1 putative uncharacterized protein DDB_G0293878 isoform X5 [Sitodiplosis mosellana]XP_055310312.1 putative uncharacterized protein DDB_G0293878 isoform X5 [Sitodiplosis mosellana]XP_055310313.1 putative uncharacterized protein DDB_G0293878 isoform X5 [Sitodiplosis mosellana]XP_055310314.1 putative unchar
MDPAVPWQYTYNRLAAQGATSGDLHHHFAQAANNSALTGGHASSVSAVPSTTSQLLLQAAHSTPLGASTASFPTPSSFLSAPSYDVFSPLFHHANPKPAHFNTINAAAQHRQQVLAAQAAVTKQTTDSDIIRENYTQHHSSISTPQTGSYFEQPGGSAVAAALGWQARGGQSDFTTLRSQGDLNSNNQLPSAFGILPHENVSSSPAPSTAAAATKHSSSSGSSTGVYESFNAHFPQPLNQANAIIKSSSTARSMSPQQQQQQSQQQIKQQNIASTSASSGYYQTPSTYQNLQSSFANSKSISQQEQLQHQQAQQHSYSNNSNQQAISGKNSRSGSIQQASAQMSLQASSTAAAATQNHLTLLGTTSNSLSHHNQSNQQHLQHHSHANNQNTNQSQSSSSNPMNQQKATPLTDKKFPTPTGPGSGFMASYLKFLQGERDTSPPPMNRGSGGGRKTWSRATTNQPVTNQSPAAGNNAQAKNQMSNGMNVHNNMMGGSIYDRKRSADDDDDASDSSNNKPVTNRNSKKQSQQPVIDRAPQVPINAAKKARTTQSSHNNSLLSSQQTSNHALSLQQNNPHSLQQNPQLLMQQHATPAHQLVAGTSQILSQQQMYYPQDNEDPLTVPQRRETSHRKAKGRSIQNALQKQTLGSDNQNDDLDEPPEFVDSDSDPAWTPNKEDDDDDDMPRRKNTRKTRNSNARSNTKRGTVKSNTYAGTTNASNIEYSNSNSSGAQQNYGTSNNPDEFQTGDFIVSRQDAFLDWPAIWRVDSTTLLQKFEPFHSNNKTIYRSLSTYAQWSPESCRSYISVKCIHIGQLQHEMHVELQRSELCAATSEMYIEKVMQEAFTSLQDQFEVYIQALISQALDSNFLTEIHQEQDEYFLSNVKTIDDLTSGRKMRLRNTMAWPTRILHSIEIWPCYNVINDLGVTNNGQIICVACNKRNIVSRVVLYGQPYNQNTIGPTQLDGRYSFDKDLLLCRSLCVVRCELLHKISHQKYLMFMQCSKKVAELNQQDPTKGTTVILNELLADEAWLSELFGLVRRAWAEVDQIERLHRVLS